MSRAASRLGAGYGSAMPAIGYAGWEFGLVTPRSKGHRVLLRASRAELLEERTCRHGSRDPRGRSDRRCVTPRDTQPARGVQSRESASPGVQPARARSSQAIRSRSTARDRRGDRDERTEPDRPWLRHRAKCVTPLSSRATSVGLRSSSRSGDPGIPALSIGVGVSIRGIVPNGATARLRRPAACHRPLSPFAPACSSLAFTRRR